MKIQRALFILIAALMLPALAQAAVGRDGLPVIDLPAATDGASNCLFAHDSLGCDDATCENTVCTVDSFCCLTVWDSICANEAISLCPVDATNPRATFAVTKSFDDGNDEQEVQVDINCFTGVPLKQSQMIKDGQTVKFVVQAFGDGELDCTVTETAVAGYEGTYIAGAGEFDFGDPIGVESDTSCQFDNVNFGQQWSCLIINGPAPVAVDVTKEWVIDGSGGDFLDATYKLVLHCDDEIVDGNQKNNGKWKKTLYNGDSNGTADTTYSAMVVPDWDGGTSCSVEETIYDSSVEATNGCTALEVNINEGDACTIVNTVFYEGIPTLSQYGMAILALLMLGMGFVGFRRFV